MDFIAFSTGEGFRTFVGSKAVRSAKISFEIGQTKEPILEQVFKN